MATQAAIREGQTAQAPEGGQRRRESQRPDFTSILTSNIFPLTAVSNDATGMKAIQDFCEHEGLHSYLYEDPNSIQYLWYVYGNSRLSCRH